MTLKHPEGVDCSTSPSAATQPAQCTSSSALTAKTDQTERNVLVLHAQGRNWSTRSLGFAF